MNTRNWTIIGVIAVLALCALCIGALALGGLFAAGVFTYRDVVRSPVGPRVESTIEEQKSFEVQTPAFLEITNNFGTTDIRASETLSGTFQVTMVKTGYGDDIAQADANLETLQVDTEESENRVIIQVEEPRIQSGTRSAKVDLRVRVPAETTVSVDSSTGQISLSGTSGKAVLHSEFGEVGVSDFSGGLSVNTGSGAIRVTQVGLLPSGNGDISLTTQFGQIRLENIQTGRLEVTSSSGQLQLSDVHSEGDAQVESEFGQITWQTGSVDHLVVKSSSGQVHLQDLDFSDEIQVETTFGEVRFRLPQESAFDVNLQTDLGRIESEFDVARTGLLQEKHWIGTVNGGGPQLTITTQSGSIFLETNPQN